MSLRERASLQPPRELSVVRVRFDASRDCRGRRSLVPSRAWVRCHRDAGRSEAAKRFDFPSSARSAVDIRPVRCTTSRARAREEEGVDRTLAPPRVDRHTGRLASTAQLHGRGRGRGSPQPGGAMASSLPSPTGRGGAVVIASEGGSSSSVVGGVGGGRRGTPDRHGGSLNHSSHALTQTVQKRRSAMTRCMTVFAASLIVFELLRHLVFVGGKFCGELPRGAPVAVLLAGSAHAFNRTHCGLANRVIAPFTRLGHPVVVFAADENGDDDAMVPALERIRKDYPNVDFVVAPPAAASQKDLHDRCVESVERRFRRMGVGPGSIYAESHQTHAVALARWEERNLDDSSSTFDDDGSDHSGSARGARPRLPGRDARADEDDALGAHRRRIVHYMRRLAARKRADGARLRWESGDGSLGVKTSSGASSGAGTESRHPGTGIDRGSPFAWIVVARPDVAFADEIPADRACLPPGGRRVHVPWFHSRGGANDRFAMAPPEGAAEYLGLYDSLCDGHALAAGEDYAGMIPRGVDSSEKVLRWHLRRRHVATDPWLLFNFVFYRVRSEASFDDRDRSPDTRLAASPFNPSRGRWSDASSELARCPAIYERSTRGHRRIEGKTTQEGAELARRGGDADVGGSNPARGGGRKGRSGSIGGTGWVGKIVEPGLEDADVDADMDADVDADGAPLGPEDLGMTGAARGKAKAGHHVTWLIASTSTEAQTLIPEWVLGFCMVFFGLAFTLIASGIVAEGLRHYRAFYANRREERERKRGDGDEV